MCLEVEKWQGWGTAGLLVGAQYGDINKLDIWRNQEHQVLWV